MSKPLVSACIITYNHRGCIKDCLEGAVSQILDYPYEIVVSDDCSTDGTSEICREYAEKYPKLIRYLRNESNLGMVGNWISAMGLCKGEYIALCEGDDYWISNMKLVKQVDFLESNSEFVASHHHYDRLHEDGKTTPNLGEIRTVQENSFVIEQFNIRTCTLVFRNILNEYPLPVCYSKLPFADWPLLFHLTLYGKVSYIKETMAVYRVNSASSSLKKLNTQLYLYIYRMFKILSREVLYKAKKLELQEAVVLNYGFYIIKAQEARGNAVVLRHFPNFLREKLLLFFYAT